MLPALIGELLGTDHPAIAHQMEAAVSAEHGHPRRGGTEDPGQSTRLPGPLANHRVNTVLAEVVELPQQLRLAVRGEVIKGRHERIVPDSTDKHQ
ncbi:hypothetical protein [Streptomyces sp. NPDC096311]|uniref:hypothetical protein n=1 Tax=Streptomyces sp. NPDC096311 TaxID=3366083 RepID=UPI0038057417